MKTIVLALLLCYILTGCYAQAELPEGKVKGRHDVFNVKHNHYSFTNRKTIAVYSTKNKYNDGMPYGKNEMEMSQKDIHFDSGVIKNIILNVLQSKLSALHKRHERVSGLIKFDLSGNVTDLAFIVDEGTLITAMEFEAIDNRLRQELKATFTGKAYLTHIGIGSDFKDIFF